ncbi:MAG: hypothetical protein ACXWVS_01895, partial [Hyphomicrobium sp.]
MLGEAGEMFPNWVQLPWQGLVIVVKSFAKQQRSRHVDDCQQEAVFVADVIRAAGMEPARVSEAARALGVRSASKGTYRKQLTVEDAVRIVATRRLQEVGVTFAAAIEAVRQVSFEVLKDIIISDEQRFLVVAPDGRVSVCNVSQLAELAVAGGGIRNLQLINLRTVIE